MAITKDTYQLFLEKLDEKYSALRKDADKALRNKSASLRVRRLSLAFRQDLKDLHRMLLDFEKPEEGTDEI